MDLENGNTVLITANGLFSGCVGIIKSIDYLVGDVLVKWLYGDGVQPFGLDEIELCYGPFPLTPLASLYVQSTENSRRQK